MRSVSASTKYEPPNGSIVFVTPVSWAMICWVRSAIRTASSVGSASASSKVLVCSDWVPPSTPANASIAVRTMLLSGCWAVSDTPAVCVWKRMSQDRWFSAAECVPQFAGPDPPRRPVLGDLLKEIDLRVEEERSRGAKSSTSSPRATACST